MFEMKLIRILFYQFNKYKNMNFLYNNLLIIYS